MVEKIFNLQFSIYKKKEERKIKVLNWLFFMVFIPWFCRPLKMFFAGTKLNTAPLPHSYNLKIGQS